MAGFWLYDRLNDNKNMRLSNRVNRLTLFGFAGYVLSGGQSDKRVRGLKNVCGM